jgi:hypothetical protein
MESLAEREFRMLQDRVREGDVLLVTYHSNKADDQSRSPFYQKMRVTNKRGSWIIGERATDPQRNRGLGIVNRVYGGDRQTLLVAKNYVGGMKDSHYRGPVVAVELEGAGVDRGGPDDDFMF